MRVLLFVGVSLLLLVLSCAQGNSTLPDAGGVPEQAATGEGALGKVPCGNGFCPSSEYICCGDKKDAPPECCLKGFAVCYTGGGGITGWPTYNGCNPQKCKAPRSKLCKAGVRNTCCREDQECGESWGVAFCKTAGCPAERECNGGKLCCSRAGICKKFRNVEYCDETCTDQGQVVCSLTGEHYGKQPFSLCCAQDSCHQHPDGWPFCRGEVY